MTENTILRSPRRHAPSVELSPDGLVRKTYDNCPALLRWTVGRLAISRECWALKRLESSPHSPKLVARPNPWTMICEFVEGKPLEELSTGDYQPTALMKETTSLLQDLWEAGVIHGDLGHDHWQSMGRESNLIWTPQGRLVAIDFAGSLPLRSSFPVLNSVVKALRRHDELLPSKMAYHFCPESAFQAEQVRWPVATWELLRFLGKL